MKTNIIVALGSFAIGLFFGWILLGTNTRESDLTWTFGKSEFKINVKQDLASPDLLLKKIFAEPFAKDGTITWLKSTQHIFPASDPDLADQISTLTFDAPLAKRLRELSGLKVGPWKQLGKEVSVGIPGKKEQPAIGQANVCESGPFRGAKILLAAIIGTVNITVQAAGIYPCPDGFEFPDLQLNASDGKKLFKDSLFRQIQKVRAVVIQ